MGLICLAKCECGGKLQDVDLGEHKMKQCDKCSKIHSVNGKNNKHPPPKIASGTLIVRKLEDY